MRNLRLSGDGGFRRIDHQRAHGFSQELNAQGREAGYQHQNGQGKSTVGQVSSKQLFQRFGGHADANDDHAQTAQSQHGAPGVGKHQSGKVQSQAYTVGDALAFGRAFLHKIHAKREHHGAESAIVHRVTEARCGPEHTQPVVIAHEHIPADSVEQLEGVEADGAADAGSYGNDAGGVYQNL